MLDDDKLAELMDMIDPTSKQNLAEMLAEMSSDDVAYFKGFVKGYSLAVRHLQMAVDDGEIDSLQFYEAPL